MRAWTLMVVPLICSGCSDDVVAPIPSDEQWDASIGDGDARVDVAKHDANDAADALPDSGPTPDTSSIDAQPDITTDDVVDSAADDAPTEADAAPGCNSGNRPLPAGLVEIAWNDSAATSDVRAQSWQITVNNHTYPLNEQVLHEAVRFDLAHPARIHGFSVQWSSLPADGDPMTSLEAGLYPDFGHNGFDFWQWQPLWAGARCLQDAAGGQWLTYVFDQPIEVSHPGLVYVAHKAQPAPAPVFAFDTSASPSGTCDLFDECHSSMNLPEAEVGSFFNGVSFSFQYDFLVKLHVEYTDQLQPEQRIFQPGFNPNMSHVSFGDYDHDGFDDMITDGPTLWRNNGDGTFTDTTSASNLAALGVTATGGVWGDYDNDGCLDLFLFAESYTAPDTLARSNCDGTFSDVTLAAGIVDNQTYENCGDAANTRSPTAAAAWVDIDADGLLDLYLSNFICWANETYYSDSVWHNLGNGTFEDWSGLHGFSAERLPSRGASPIDHDGDGDVDVLINNYRLKRNLFFDNQGDGTVLERGREVGLAGVQHPVGLSSYFGHTIGVAWGDLDNDGDFDQVAANLAHPRFYNFSDKTEVLLQGPTHTFVDLAGDWALPASGAGLRYQETHSVPVLADFDLDGNLDLVITAIYDGRPTDFYWGNGDGTFRLDAYHTGITTRNGWGVSAADVDNDGDPDVFAQGLFTNEITGVSKGHWLQVRVVGNAGSNTMGIGSTVRVTADGVTRLRHVQGGSGKGGQDSQYLVFGLGQSSTVQSIGVTFPGGKVVNFAGPFNADQRIWVYEDGTAAAGWVHN